MADPLSADDQIALRAHFREHWEEGVPFNRWSGLRITRWDDGGTVFELPYRDDLSAHPGVFHGGVLSALIDTCGCGAVMAGQDFSRGSRLTTVSLSVQYLSVAPGEDARAEGRCTRRGRSANFAEVHVYAAGSGKPLAQGIVAANVSGVRDGFDRLLAAARRNHRTDG